MTLSINGKQIGKADGDKMADANVAVGAVEVTQEMLDAAEAEESTTERTTKSGTKLRSVPKPGTKAKALTPAQKEREAARKAKEKDREAAKKQKEKDAAAAKKQKEKDAAAVARDEEKRKREEERNAPPKLDALVAKKAAGRGKLTTLDVSKIVGENDGDPVSDSFVKSVKLLGKIFLPISVRANDDGTYTVIDGKRRVQAAKKLGLATVDASIETRADANDTISSIALNVNRSENVMDQSAKVVAAISQLKADGMTERQAVKALAEATGLTGFQIKRARDVAGLHPELAEAVRDGRMGPWGALNAARQPMAVQERIVEEMNEREDRRVTAEMIRGERRMAQYEAVSDAAQVAKDAGVDMFSAPDAEYAEGMEHEAPEIAKTPELVEKAFKRVDQRAAALEHFQLALKALQTFGDDAPDDILDCVAYAEGAVTRLTES